MYKSFFGLTEAPFSISPNPKFFYLSEHHREALELLRHGVLESGGFVLFTGEVGTGKTVILRTLKDELPENINQATIYNPNISLMELLVSICEEFKITLPKVAEEVSKKEVLQSISKYLTEQHAIGKKAVIFIDEAQHLSDEAIEEVRLLTNTETNNEKLLQVVLVGQPELIDRLKQQHMRQVAQRITARFHLLPLAEEEVYAYVRYRLQAAGCRQLIFRSLALRELYQATKGIPRMINVVSDMALCRAYKKQSPYVELNDMVAAINEYMGNNPNELYAHGVGLGNEKNSNSTGFIKTLQQKLSSIFNKRTSADDQLLEDIHSRISNVGKDAKEDSAEISNKTSEIKYTSVIGKVFFFAFVFMFWLLVGAGITYGVKYYKNNYAYTTQEKQANQLELLRNNKTLMDKKERLQRLQKNINKIDDLIRERSRFISDISASAFPESAWSNLLREWGIANLGQNIDLDCQIISSKGYRCVHNTGSLDDIVKYNVPVSIQLLGKDLNPYYVVLLGINDKEALVLINGREWVLPIDYINKSYEGDYWLIWQLPNGSSQVNSNSSQATIKLLRVMLDNLLQDEYEYTSWNSSFNERIKQAQAQLGLKADGVVGVDTLWALMPYSSQDKQLLQNKVFSDTDKEYREQIAEYLEPIESEIEVKSKDIEEIQDVKKELEWEDL